MGDILFWIEAAITTVLFVALGSALASRIKLPGNRGALRVLWFLLAVAPWATAIIGLAYIDTRFGGARWPLVGFSAGAACALIAAIIVVIRGRGRVDTIRRAAQWRLGRLSLAFAAALLLTAMTYWNLDLAVQQDMSVERVKAGAIALSLAPARIPDSQNAALLYKQAWEALDAGGEVTLLVPNEPISSMPESSSAPAQSQGKTQESTFAPQQPQSVEEKRKWGTAVEDWLFPGSGSFNPNDPCMNAFLQKNAPIMALLRQAKRLPGCNFQLDFTTSVWEFVTPMGNMRRLADLMCLSAKVNAAHDREKAAVEDAEACFAMAEHCSGDPSIIGALVTCTLEGRGIDALQAALDSDHNVQSSLASLKVIPMLSFSAGMHRAMQMEQVWSTITFSDFARKLGLTYLSEDLNSVPSWCWSPYRVFLLRQDLAAHNHWMGEYVRLSDMPYVQAQPLLETTLPRPHPRLGGLFTHMLLPYLNPTIGIAAAADAQHRLVQTAVGLCRYKQDHGEFPEDLAALTPQYMLTVPLDPFSDKPLKFIRDQDGQVEIYSVGPDMVDDGGQPAKVKNKYYYDGSAKGDIVLRLGK